MLKVLAAFFFYAAVSFGQSSSDGLFVVQNVRKSGSLLTAAQMRQAEKLYQSACTIVKNDFHGAMDLHPRFTVIIGTDHNEVHGRSEIWLKQWNPAVFTEGVVVLAFEQVLTPDTIKQLGERAVRYTDATIDVADVRRDH
jgi:hypothetical protein